MSHCCQGCTKKLGRLSTPTRLGWGRLLCLDPSFNLPATHSLLTSPCVTTEPVSLLLAPFFGLLPPSLLASLPLSFRSPSPSLSLFSFFKFLYKSDELKGCSFCFKYEYIVRWNSYFCHLWRFLIRQYVCMHRSKTTHVLNWLCVLL